MKKLLVYLRAGFLDVSLGQYKRRKNAQEDITLKYIRVGYKVVATLL
jgi:hypothetical protein